MQAKYPINSKVRYLNPTPEQIEERQKIAPVKIEKPRNVALSK